MANPKYSGNKSGTSPAKSRATQRYKQKGKKKSPPAPPIRELRVTVRNKLKEKADEMKADMARKKKEIENMKLKALERKEKRIALQKERDDLFENMEDDDDINGKHQDYWDPFYDSAEFEKALKALNSGKSKQKKKALELINKKVEEHFGESYITKEVADYFEKYDIDLPQKVNDPKYCKDEIRALRYDAVMSKKHFGMPHYFTVYCGPRGKKETVIQQVPSDKLDIYFAEGFLDTCKEIGQRAGRGNIRNYQPIIYVPIGDTNEDEGPEECFCKYIGNDRSFESILPYQQGDKTLCLGYCAANVLFFAGLYESAEIIAAEAVRLSVMDAESQLKAICNLIEKHAKNIGVKSKQECYDVLNGQRTPAETIKALKPYDMVLLIPSAGDGTNAHSVMYCEGLIFDATQKYPMYLNEDTLQFVAGSTGFGGIWNSRIFTINQKKIKDKKKYFS